MPRWEQPCSRKTRFRKIRKKNAPTNSSVKEARAYVLVPENCDASPPEDISSPESTRTSTPDEILSKDSSCSSWSPRSWSPEIDDDSPPSPILNRHNAKRKAKFNYDVTSDSKNEFEPEVHKRSGEIFGDSFIKDRLVKLHNSVVVPVKRNCTIPKPANCRNGTESTSGLASSGLSNLVQGEPYKLSTELVSSYVFNNDLMCNGYKIEPHDEFSNLVEEQSELRTAVDGSYGFSNNLVGTSNELTNLVVAPYGLGNNMELPVELSQIKQEDEFHECVYIKEEPHDVSQQLEIKQEIDSSIDPPETVFLNEFPLESIVKEEKVEYV